jgi:hypothetical protein
VTLLQRSCSCRTAVVPPPSKPFSVILCGLIPRNPRRSSPRTGSGPAGQEPSYIVLDQCSRRSFLQHDLQSYSLPEAQSPRAISVHLVADRKTFRDIISVRGTSASFHALSPSSWLPRRSDPPLLDRRSRCPARTRLPWATIAAGLSGPLSNRSRLSRAKKPHDTKELPILRATSQAWDQIGSPRRCRKRR